MLLDFFTAEVVSVSIKSFFFPFPIESNKVMLLLRGTNCYCGEVLAVGVGRGRQFPVKSAALRNMLPSVGRLNIKLKHMSDTYGGGLGPRKKKKTQMYES